MSGNVYTNVVNCETHVNIQIVHTTDLTVIAAESNVIIYVKNNLE